MAHGGINIGSGSISASKHHGAWRLEMA